MAKDARPLIPYQVAPEYPSQEQAIAYAEDFRTGAAGAYEHDERWARYWLTSRLDVLTTQLQTNIYTSVAYPPGGFEFAEAGEVDSLEYFRGWILEYHPDTQEWVVLAASQEVGIDEFIRLRRQYKGG